MAAPVDEPAPDDAKLVAEQAGGGEETVDDWLHGRQVRNRAAYQHERHDGERHGAEEHHDRWAVAPGGVGEIVRGRRAPCRLAPPAHHEPPDRTRDEDHPERAAVRQGFCRVRASFDASDCLHHHLAQAPTQDDEQQTLAAPSAAAAREQSLRSSRQPAW